MPEITSARRSEEALEDMRLIVVGLSKQITVTNLFLEAMQQVLENFIDKMPMTDQMDCLSVIGERHLKFSEARQVYCSNDILYRVPNSSREHLLRGIASHEVTPIQWILEQEAEGVSVSLSNFVKLLKIGNDELCGKVEDYVLQECQDIFDTFVKELNAQIETNAYSDKDSKFRQEQEAWAPAIVSSLEALAAIRTVRLEKSLTSIYPSLVGLIVCDDMRISLALRKVFETSMTGVVR
mmetsp:Transcript_4603/g.16472  ORF Transcript_4603/g.16472 Transcript_4603/m.16472 type:complete len:238 (+) Transcript_4603:421-1134(+)